MKSFDCEIDTSTAGVDSQLDENMQCLLKRGLQAYSKWISKVCGTVSIAVVLLSNYDDVHSRMVPYKNAFQAP